MAWGFAILLIGVLIVGLGYLNQHPKLTSGKVLKQIFQSHPAPMAAKPSQDEPEYDFYTALPKGQLEEIATPTTKGATAPATSTTQATTTPTPTATVKPEPKSVPAGTQYFLQVASFPAYSDADKLKAQLLMNSYNANIQKTTVNNHDWYRVVVGPYYNLNTLSQAQDALAKMHYSTIRLMKAPN
jgi:cell division protein FtsN